MTEPEIQAFLEVVRLGSITAAANRLYVSQPALSRRIRTLEEELGYTLLLRSKGVRNAELTDKGRAFIPVAEKYLALWQEAREVTLLDKNTLLNISAVGSVSSYILPTVLSRFLEGGQNYSLNFRTCHSFEAYEQVGTGQVDLALISDDMYTKYVETLPLFREAMLLVVSRGDKYQGRLHPSQLDGTDEIRLPWNPEYDLWHDFWFKTTVRPRVCLNQMSLMEHFLHQENVWAIVPASAARRLACSARLPGSCGARVCELEEGPPDRIIYYLTGRAKGQEKVQHFLEILTQELERIEGIELFRA